MQNDPVNFVDPTGLYWITRRYCSQAGGGPWVCETVDEWVESNDDWTTSLNPLGGSVGPIGGFTVTATVIVRPFDVCLQDDSVPSRAVLWNTFTGDYVFTCGGSGCPPAGGTTPGGTSTQTGGTQTGGT